MGMMQSYRLRVLRRHYLLRAFRSRRSLTELSNKTAQIAPDHALCFLTVRNELRLLPYFLKYYRNQGIDHFLIVDNGSDDGSAEYLANQPDVSLWHTNASYKSSRFGMNWINWLLMKYGTGHWCLTVDTDEFLVFPFCDTRPIRALTDWLQASEIRAFGAMLLDMYPRGGIDEVKYEAGQDPFEIAAWFDSGNYTYRKNPLYRNLWIQGGPRAREFFADQPEKAPALNKIPLVHWKRHYCYASSTHMLLPRGLNLVYDEEGGEKASGCLLHAKFLDTLLHKISDEELRQQHFSGSAEYQGYREHLAQNPNLWCKWSEKYINWRQLEILGLMSKGNWA